MPYGIPEAAVLAVIAGTDLLCLGRDTDEPTFLAVRRALADAVRDGRLPAIAAGLSADAGGRSLVIVVRDAHRYPAAIALVEALLAARPDTVVVEMGLPVGRPPAASYLASYGAARASGLAVAQILGLAMP